MIFVTVGTHMQGFERLIKAVDEIVECKKIKDEVIIQIGHSKYIPKYCKWFRFISFKEFVELSKLSKLVITHAGVGSIAFFLQHQIPTIVVPRRKDLNEHTDDHQIQITKEMEKQGLIIPVYDINNLENAIEKVKKFKIKKRQKKNSEILNLINNKLKEWERQ